MKKDKDVINNKEYKKEYEAPEIEVNKFNNSGDPVEMLAEDVTDYEMNGNMQEFDKTTENTVVDNQNTNKHKKHNNKKNKKPHKRLSEKQKIAILSCSLIIVILVIVLICLYLYQSSQNNIVLANDTVIIEYGEEYIPSVEDFVELTDAITLDNTYIEYELEYKEVLDEETGEAVETYAYPEVGEYDITVYHSFDFKLFGLTVFTSIISNEAEIVVEDTTAPEFQEEVATEITTYQDMEIDADTLAEKFDVYDLSEVELIIDDSLIDYETVGEYETTVCAKDIYNNSTTINVVVKVKEPSVSVEPSNVELTVGETQELSVKVHGLSEKDTTYSSDEESVATVSDDGVITAVKKGTATITVENNGKKNTVTVTVVAASSSTTSNSSSSANKSSTSGSTSSSKNSSTNTNTSSGSSSSNNSVTNSNNSSSTTDCYEGGSYHSYYVLVSSDPSVIGFEYCTELFETTSFSETKTLWTAYCRDLEDHVNNYQFESCWCGRYFVVYNLK